MSADFKHLIEAERKRADRLEAQLAEANAFRRQWHGLHTALSHTPDFIYSFDLDGRFTYVNRALLSLLQKTWEEAVGKDFFELGYPPDLASRLQRQIQEVIESRNVLRDETPYTDSTGAEGVYEYIFVPVLGRGGQVTAVTGSTRDITARAFNEATLRESERRFSSAFAEAPVGMILMTPAGEFIDANRAYLDMLGYSLEELAAQTSDPFTHPDDIAATHAFGEAFRQGKQRTGVLEKRYIRKDGQLLWARAAGTMRYGPDGKATQFIAIIEDITQQKRAEAALKESEERLHSILVQAPVAVCVLRAPEFVFELANEYYQCLFPGSEVSAELLKIVHDVYRSGEPFLAEEFNLAFDRDRDGLTENYWFNFLYHPLKGPQGTVERIVTVAVDVTSQVRARQALEQANASLEEFAHVASHDLQEPLRMVKIYSQLLVRGLEEKSAAELRSYGQFVETGTVRMETLIRDLLAYSKSDHTEEDSQGTVTADLNGSLQAAMEAVDTRIHECGAQVSICALPVVIGNERQLAHVFQNLLTNALKYRKPDIAPDIRISLKRQNGRCVVGVTDNGIGFDQRYAEQVFGLFTRLHDRQEYPGTGLGLAICKRIVERYRGRMWAESQVGVGSTFYFALLEAPVAPL